MSTPGTRLKVVFLLRIFLLQLCKAHTAPRFPTRLGELLNLFCLDHLRNHGRAIVAFFHVRLQLQCQQQLLVTCHNCLLSNLCSSEQCQTLPRANSSESVPYFLKIWWSRRWSERFSCGCVDLVYLTNMLVQQTTITITNVLQPTCGLELGVYIHVNGNRSSWTQSRKMWPGLEVALP